MSNFSVLMTAYSNDNPEFLKLAIDSMLNQTVRTDDFVIVCDGPLTSELDAVLKDFSDNNPNVFNIKRLERNVGLGKALRIGLLECKYELVARMDDDDIAISDRCEKQIDMFNKYPRLSIIGSYMDEFEDDYKSPFRTKSVPCNIGEIRKYSRRRNPFNHSTVMFKKSAILAAGNYSEMCTNQDVELWVRLLNSGYIGYNIPESLVLFRFDKNTYKRRKKWTNIKLLIEVWKGFQKNRYCSISDYLFVYWSQIAIYIMPSFILKWLYRISRKAVKLGRLMPNDKKTIVYIGDFDFRNENVQSYLVKNNAKIFSTIGFQVYFVGIDRLNTDLKSIGNTKMDNNNYLELPNSLNLSGLFKCKDTCDTILEQLDELNRKYDVTHVITYQSPTYAVALRVIAIWCKSNSIKYIVNCADIPVFDSQPFIKRVVMKWNWIMIHKYTKKYADKVIAVSKMIENFYRKEGRKIIVIPPLFDKKEFNFKHSEPKAITRFIYAGTPFVQTKGKINPKGMKDRLDKIIDWFVELSNRGVDYSLAIVGISKDNYVVAVPRHKDCLANNPKIHFFGKLKHIQTLELVADSDFSINYRDENEMTKAGFSTKIVESISLGTPVVTNDASDIARYLLRDSQWFELKDDSSKNIELIWKLAKISQLERKDLKERCLSNVAFCMDTYLNQLKEFLMD